MAYQPKSYRKFVATAATATLVASAIAPVVSAASFTDVTDSYKDAVDFLVSKGVNGKTATSFGVSEQITRADAAVMLVKVLGLDTENAPAAGFTDVPARAVKEVNALKAAGITAGKSATSFGASDLITRGELAVWIKKGFDLTGDAELKFTDVAANYADAVKALVANGVTSGVSETKFGTAQNAKRGDYAKFLYKAALAKGIVAPAPQVVEITSVDSDTLTLKIKGELKEVKASDFAFDGGLEVKDAKIVEAPKAAAEEVYTYVELTTSTQEPGKTYTLTKFMGKDVPAADAPKVEAPATPAVVSVSAINNKQLVITFNKPVDSTSVNFTSNITRTGTGTAVLTGSTFSLSEDKKTLTVNLATAAAQQEAVEVVVKNIKTTDGKTFPEFKQTVTFVDTQLPTVEGVTVTGSKDLKVTFSEPVQTAPTVKVIMNGVTYQPTLTITGNDRKTGTLTLPVDFVEGTHSLEIEGGADYAGFKVAKVTKQFTFTKDTTAITATVKESTETSVTLKFNKPISDLSSNAVAQYLVFSHTYKGQNAVTNNGSGFSGGSITKVADDEYTINFSQPLPPGTTTVYFDYAANTADANKVKDGYGNILQPFSFTVNTAADTVKPQVSSVEFVDANKVKVVFSEKVDNTTGPNGARNTANYVLKDAQGNIVAINSITNVNSDFQTFELTTDTISGGSYTLEVKNIKDRSVAQNTLDTVTKGFTAADKVAPTVNTTAEVLGQKKIRIKFSEAMDKASIENKDNYNVDSNVIITAAPDNKSVILDYTNVTPAVDFTAGPATTTILVGQVKDAAGNKTANFSTTVTVTHGTPTVNAEKVEVIARDKVKLTIPGVITNVTNNDFAVKVTGESTPSAASGWATANVLSSAAIGGKTEIVLQLPTPVAAADTELDASSNKGVVVATGTVNTGALAQAAATNAQNEFGAKVNIPMTLAADKVGPEVLSRTTADADGDGYIDSLAITFSENLFAGSVTADDFVVDGYTIEGVKSVVGDTVTLALKERNVYDTGATPNVKVVGTVEDVLRNASTAETAATAATDSIAPVLVGTSLASDDKTLTLTFSENIANNTADANALKAAITFAANGSTFGALAAGDSVAISGNKLTITFNSALTGNTNKVKIAANTLKDTASTPVVQSAAITTAAIDATTN